MAFGNLILRGLFEVFAVYHTPKIVTIKSLKVGLLYRFVQFGIIGYIVGYAIIYNKGYQEKDIGQSSVVTKVKGLASTLHRRDLPEYYRRIWDTPDYVVPPMSLLQLKDSLFVTTNAIITPKQQIQRCPEDPNVGSEAICKRDEDCKKGFRIKHGNGDFTGSCVRSNKTFKHTCQITTWCPLENDYLSKAFFHPLIRDVPDFTMLIKNTIEFPKFRAKKRNVDSVSDPTYLKTCLYHSTNDNRCPILSFRDVFSLSQANITQLLIFGGVINVLIRWDCNLDYSIDFCTPNFEFSLMDKSGTTVSPGYNFRYANYYRDQKGIMTRDLIKAFGVLFVFNVKAEAGKFSFARLALNIGAGLALLGLSRIFMDMIVLYVDKNRQYYKQQKFVTVTKDERKNCIKLTDCHPLVSRI